MNTNDNLRNYEAEEEFLNSPYNKSTYYIPGKVITIDEDGNIRFLIIDDISSFVYGQDIEPQFLFDEYLLDVQEKALVAKLRAINSVISVYNIQAVYIRQENDTEYIFIISNENPEQFWKISYADINFINSNNDFQNGSPNIEHAQLIKFN